MLETVKELGPAQGNVSTSQSPFTPTPPSRFRVQPVPYRCSGWSPRHHEHVNISVLVLPCRPETRS